LGTLLAGLVGAIAWNLLAWLAGLPSSSSHALIGGVVGATLTANGADVLAYKLMRLTRERTAQRGYRIGQTPLWVKLASATAIACGTAIGGWRIIQTMGHGWSSWSRRWASAPRRRAARS
jgi:PiT family inorganic phosphate transporter